MGHVESVSVQFALLAVARTTAASVPDEIDAATARAKAAGHSILTDEIIADSEAAIRERLTSLIANPEVDVVLVLAGAESDAASKALKPLISEVLPGFTDLFRWLMFQEAGASAMLSSAEAAQCGSTLVFVLPGAIPAAMEKLILPQFDPKTTPRNLVDRLPRLRTEPGVREGVPQPIPVEKTQGGSGIHTRLPAIPSGRLRSRTGANVVHREQPTDDPTKPIDLEKLELDLAASTPDEVLPSDDRTRPMDLGVMRPAATGADPDTYTADADDDHTDVTLAAPPPPALFPRPMAIPSIAKPPPRANPTGARGISPSTPPRITNPSTPPVRRDLTMTPATPMPAVTINPRVKKPEPARTAEPAKPLDAKTAAIEAQRARDASASAEARKRALTPKPISVTPPKPTEWEQQPAAATKRDSGRHAAIVPDDVAVATLGKNLEPKYGDPARRAESPAIAATSGTTSAGRRDATDVAQQHGRPEPSAHDFDARPTVRVVPGVAAAVPASDPEGPTAVRNDAVKPADLAGPTGGRRESSNPIAAAITAAAEANERRESAKPIVAKPATDARTSDSSPAAAAKHEPPLAHINGATVHEASDLDAAETVDGMRAIGSTSSTEALEKIDPADLIEGADDASPAEIRSVLMKDVAPVIKPVPARSITEPPPPPAKRPSTEPPPAAKPVAKRTPTAPPPARTSVDELPRGSFAYPVKKHRGSLALKLLLAAVILGAGFFAVVLMFRDKEAPSTTPPEPSPAPVASNPTPPPEPMPVAAPDAAIDEPDIEMDPTPAKAGSADPKPKQPKTPATPKTPTTPNSGSNAVPATATTNPAPPADAAVAVVDDDCDETSCILSKYERACCAKYKPATTDFKPRVGDVPESLDKSMVRAGVERVKPRVVACGEKSPVKGTVRISLAVAPDGAVTTASVADAPDPALGACVLSAMKSAKFGKTVNGASFTYPFAF